MRSHTVLQGFDVERIPNVFAMCIIQPAPINQVYEPRPKYFTQFAIDHHNKNKNKKEVCVLLSDWLLSLFKR